MEIRNTLRNNNQYLHYRNSEHKQISSRHFLQQQKKLFEPPLVVYISKQIYPWISNDMDIMLVYFISGLNQEKCIPKYNASVKISKYGLATARKHNNHSS